MKGKNPFLIACVGCGIVSAITCVIVAAVGIFWLATSPEGGVRLSNEMEDYATEYLAKHEILRESEELIAYYDATLTLNGSEAIILTSERVIHHKDGENDSVNLAEIDDILHTKEGITGDVFTIITESGRSIKLEIAPLNGGDTFNSVLMDAWQRARGQ